jgi:hypothetical protein
MIRISRIFKDLFDDQRISVSELIKFSSDGIERLRANNPANVFDRILADTESKHKALEDAVNKLGINISQREGRTIDMNDVMGEFKKKASHVEGLISYTFQRESGTYQEFYPKGKTEYTNMTVENAEILISRFVSAVNNHAAELPESVLTDFHVNGAQTALQLQWTINVLTVALEFTNQPEKAAVYFNQALLNDVAGQPYARIENSVDGNSIAAIEYETSLVKNKTPLTFRNQSTDSTLEFYFATTQGIEPNGHKIQVDADSERIITAAEIGFDSKNVFLQVKNLDPLAAEWEVEMPE